MQTSDPEATLPPAGDGPAGSLGDLARGTNLGRYVILEKIGSGGMGVVYAAYDSGLDRKVAIKLLHPDTTGEALAVRQERLLREARAMAKLSNPNVNTVFDVGVFGGSLFLAMELIEGQTLKGWLAERPRTWREVVGVFLQAGRGLRAAHEAGLVHRDVKPDNLLIGNDGRVRVTDFGLVSWNEAVRATVPVKEAEAVRVEEKAALTRTGGLLGSPAYMAPEQIDGGKATPASDQFSFCVALCEALTGTRPFSGTTLSEVLENVRAGRIEAGSRVVPSFLLQAVRRGLSADPAARWPTLAGLLDELERDPARTRRRVLSGVAFGLAALAGGLGLIVALRGGGPGACEEAGRHMAGVWDEPARGAVREAFERTGLPQARPSFERVERGLSAYAAAWVAERREACLATRQHGEQSEALLDLRMRCLDRRLQEVQALVRVLAEADDEVMGRAESAVAVLPALAACRDARTLSAEVEPPADPAGRAKIAAVEEKLARGEALLQAGRYQAALEEATAASALAADAAFKPIQAEALLLLGRAQDRNGMLAEAEESLNAALLAAEAGRADRAAAQAWIQLVSVVGDRRGRYLEGQKLAEHAQAALERLGPDPGLETTLAIHRGNVLTQEKRYAEAHERYSAALEARRKLFGPEDPRTLDAMGYLATNLRHQAKLAEAEQIQREVLAIVERTQGATHPNHAQAESDLAAILFEQGRHDESLALQQRALATWEATLREGHPSLGNAYNRMAAAHLKLGQVEEAIALFHKAYAVRRKAFGPNHTQTADVLFNLGVLYNQLRRYDRAKEQFELAAAGYLAAQGPASPKVAVIEYAICGMLRHQGRTEEGLAHCQRSREVFEQGKGEQPLPLSRTLLAIGQAQLELRRPQQALEPLEKAARLQAENKAPPNEIAEGRFALARALWDTGTDRARALDLGKQAWAAYREAKGVDDFQKKMMADWIKARGLEKKP